MNDNSLQETINKLWVRALWMNHGNKTSVQVLQLDDEAVIHLRVYREGTMIFEKRYYAEQLELALKEGANLAGVFSAVRRIGPSPVLREGA